MAARRRWKRILVAIVVVVVVGAIAEGVSRMRKVQAAVNPPTARARKGEFAVIVVCRGELTVKRSVQLVAPVNVPDLKCQAASG
jgi:hypothetical protein